MNESSTLKRSIYFIPRAVLRDVPLLILILALVAGCASLDVAPKSATKADNAIRIFVESTPTAGRTGQVKISGKVVLIDVERLYESASGQACRQYHLSSSQGVPSTSSSYLACRGAGDHWFLSRLLVNPGLLTGPQGSASHRASKP